MSTRPYVVVQGDTLASIAAAHGIKAAAIWNHHDNADLAKRRTDPSILRPGDVLYLPQSERTWFPVKVGETNTFTAKVATHATKLVLGAGEPLANEPYVIEGVGPDISGTTDGNGALSVVVPVTLRSFVLRLPNRNVSHPVLVGHLDPADGASGVGQRLSNLGYASALARFHEPFGVAFDPASELQVRLFQQAAGLAPSGTVDAATLDALKKTHGV